MQISKIFVLSTMLMLGSFEMHPITKCDCNSLLSEADCKQQSICSWNSSVCKTKVPEQESIETYCGQFNSSNCAQHVECAFYDNKCEFFTSCFLFTKTSDKECQDISTRCISDGTRCFEITTCDAYLKPGSCRKNSSQGYCYWDSNKCIDATECYQLTTLTTDAECRSQYSYCTATGQREGGCKISEGYCADQKEQKSCDNYLDKCFWTGSDCVEKNCSNAPNTYVTDQQCREIKETCTTQQSGGCVERSTCEAAIEQSCTTNNLGEQCYWNGQSCVNKICTNAPINYITNQDCQKYLSTCITNGFGCITNQTCSSAIIKVACYQDAHGNECFWDHECKEKICVNAPSDYNTHLLCTSFLPSCTVNKDGTGCVNRTCENAPNNWPINQCESYLPDHNCIATANGGCITNTICSEITLASSCVKDAYGSPCFWDDNLKICLDKTCQNAPSSYNKNEQCVEYMNNCAISPSGTGCVDRICTNLTTPFRCTKDMFGNTCKYEGVCYQKQCVLAPSYFSTFQQCNNYLDTCTVSNTGSGCSSIPLKCENITIKNACFKKRIIQNGTIKYGNCGWNGQVCIDEDCTTIDKSINTTAKCNEIIVNCVSANPINGVVEGCMKLSLTCASRLSADNCEVQRSGYPTCLWNTNTFRCIEKTCFTASVSGISGVLDTFSAASCRTYLPECIVANDLSSCISQVQSCGYLVSVNNCIDGAKVNNQDCFWNGNVCVDKTCENINYTNHSQCYSALQTCTVNASLTGCFGLQALCSQYSIQYQCIINSLNQQCVWDSQDKRCKDQECTSADSSYINDSMCENYLVPNQICTVASKIGMGCMSKENQCEKYREQSQCYTDLNGLDCLWYVNKCWTKKSFQCSYILPSDVCEYVVYFCKNAENGCQLKVCSDYSRTDGTSTGYESVSNHEQCQQIDKTCTISNEATRNCQVMFTSCDQYTSPVYCTYANEGQCVWVQNTQLCVPASSPCSSFVGEADAICYLYNPFCKAAQYANSTTQCISVGCEFKLGDPYTIFLNDCQKFDSSCIVNNDYSQCLTTSYCEYYTTSNTCSYNTQGQKCYWDSTEFCITISPSTCNKITSFDPYTFSCKSYNSQCENVRDNTTCYTIPETCSSIVDINQCVVSKTGPCIQSQIEDDGARCLDITQNTPCNQMILKAGTAYAVTTCMGLSNKCINYASGLGCQERTCDNNAYGPYTFTNCNAYLSSCTGNGVDKCVQIQPTCLSQSISACYQSQEGPCEIYNGQCVKKSCETASNSLSIHSDCEAYLSSCTVSRHGGCQARSTCNNYQSEQQCNNSSSGTLCIWNSIKYQCRDLSCENFDESYDTHEKCYNTTQLKCTIRSLGGVQFSGCQPLDKCSSYGIQAQCVVNSNGGDCVWNTNISTPACQDKNCLAASKIYKNHTSCQMYLNSCTVAVTESNGVLLYGGCTDLKDCSQYLYQDQCHIDSAGNVCGWNGYKCANKSCATAPKTIDFNDHSKCQTYMIGCTVSESGLGCTDLKQCQGYTIEKQCINDLNGQPCLWYIKFGIGQCVSRTCDNAPSTSSSDQDCDDYLKGCALSHYKCRNKICEDLLLPNDELCKAAMSTCTSNGTNCVLRTTCEQSLTKYGCIKSSNGQLCQWIETDQQAYCVTRNCSTAEKTLQTEQECSYYYPGCTTKYGGGCINKSSCLAATIQASCTTDIYGSQCQWDATLKICRDKSCQDYQGQTHKSCQLISSNCTIGLNGYCADMTTCFETTIQQACIIGTDGPCQWIVMDTNNSIGACYRYSDCTSLTWQTNTECNRVQNCITNGLNCVGITPCNQIQSFSGCVKGTDGDCYYDNSSKKCKLFENCSDGQFTNYENCQIYNKSCTTDGNKCIELNSCENYNQQGCVKRKDGNNCTWQNESCRNQICEDLNQTTYLACNALNSNCTSDGTKCVQIGECSTYIYQISCQTEEKCFWDSDRNSCISKSNCSNYVNQIQCNLGATEGICVYSSNTCVLMPSCNSADKNQIACEKAKDRCFWSSEGTTTSCSNHTCSSYYATYGICSHFLNWNQTQQQLCTLTNGKCGTKEPTDLSETFCFSASQYTYYWNPKIQKCTVCQNANDTTNVTNNTNNHTSTQGENKTNSEFGLIAASLFLFVNI